MANTSHKMAKVISELYIGQVLVSRVSKELRKLNTRKTHNPFLKWGMNLNREASNEIQVVEKHFF